MIAELERQTRALALALNVGGLMNVQYAIKDGDIYMLEVNPRASRTVPFVAKVIGLPVAKIAARVMAGETLASFKLTPLNFDLKNSRHVGVKEAVFPFARFGDKVDTVLGPEMKSTGEVMGLDRDYSVAFAKSQLGGGTRLPKDGTVFVSVRDGDKPKILESLKTLPDTRIRGGGDVGHPALPGRKRRRGGQDQQGGGGPARTSSMPSKTAGFSLFSTPPRGRPPWPTASRCGGRPSCIKCRTTPLFQVPSLRRRASRPTLGATSRSARCKAISADRPEGRRRTLRRVGLPFQNAGGRELRPAFGFVSLAP